MPTLTLIDGTATIHRAYHALPRLTTSLGEPVNAVYGFIKMTMKILKEEHPDYLAVCFDTPEDTFRHGLYPSYKANRTAMEDDLASQMPLVREVVTAWGLPQMEKPGFEADDIIASLARKGEQKGWTVVIVTGDKDMLQLVNPHITILNDAKGVRYDTKKVEERYGLPPERLVDFFSLVGDAIDNVPGVPGIGEKTAVKLLKDYGSLEKIIENSGGLKPSIAKALLENKDRLLLNRKLVTLDSHASLDLDPGDCRPKPPGPEWTKMLKRLEFSSLLREFMEPSDGKESPFDVKIVLQETDLADLEKKLSGAAHLSLDVETTGLDPRRCGLVGIALAFSGQVYYVPVGHHSLGSPPQLAKEKVLDRFKKYLEDPKLPKWGQNLKFDVQVLEAQGLRVQGLAFDTLVAAYCLNPSRLTYKLKDMALDLLGIRMTRMEELTGASEERGVEAVPVETTARYAGADAAVVVKLKELFEAQIRERKLESLFYQVEMPLVPVLARMESDGIRVDPERLRLLGQEFEKEKTVLETAIHELTGTRFNLNSPKQLAEVLFEKLKLPVVRKTKTGYSTDEEVLKRLKKDHPACEKLIQYRELSKLKSTYIDALLEMIDPGTGRVHTSFHQSGTTTGRLSSSDPNLQNIPVRTELGRKIRRAFVPEPGFLFVSADYSQIDLRVLAHMSGDPALQNAFRTGGDIHRATAAEVFHLPPESVTSELRNKAKAINFGIVYGQQAFGLSQQLDIPVEEAKNTIDKYFARYGGVKRWIEKTIEEAKSSGAVSTLLGRRRELQEINSKNSFQRSFAERAAMNTPIQGTSADIIKLAMIKIHELLKGKESVSRMLVQVHDELLFEIREGDVPALIPTLKETMENALLLSIPLVVDVKAGSNWADLEPWKPR